MPVNLPQFNFGGPNPLGDTYYGTPSAVGSPEPSFTDRLRMSSIFDDGGDSAAQPGAYDPNMNQGGMPQTQGLMDLLGEMPESQGPGMLQKIAASMIALNDPRLAMTLLQQPDQALVDWQNQVDAAQQAAGAEQTMREFQGRATGRDLESRRAGIAEERLDIDWEKLERELTPEAKHALEIEKIDLRQDNAMDLVRERAEVAKTRNDIQHSRALDLVLERAEASRETTKQSQERGERIAISKGEREAQEKVTTPRVETGAAQKKRITDALNRPENRDLEQWFEITGAGVRIRDVDEVDQPFNWPGVGKSRAELNVPLKRERQRAYELLYGTEDTVTGPIETEGKIRVRAPDGKEGNWPAGEELPKDYTRVQ